MQEMTRTTSSSSRRFTHNFQRTGLLDEAKLRRLIVDRTYGSAVR